MSPIGQCLALNYGRLRACKRFRQQEIVVGVCPFEKF